MQQESKMQKQIKSSYTLRELPLQRTDGRTDRRTNNVNVNVLSFVITKFFVLFRELLLLSMTVSMGMLIFAGLGYALEKDEPNTMFYTLPQTLYWAIITMTSTGYGDIAPTTAAGKLVASLCAICGVLCITLPIPIIVANFNRSDCIVQDCTGWPIILAPIS